LLEVLNDAGESEYDVVLFVRALAVLKDGGEGVGG